uniref:Uncharacterized protein n=1 Tax=Anguilla anguilla TaxID=7936 RepID=A0A0E9QH30_ANGAN
MPLPAPALIKFPAALQIFTTIFKESRERARIQCACFKLDE